LGKAAAAEGLEAAFFRAAGREFAAQLQCAAG